MINRRSRGVLALMALTVALWGAAGTARATAMVTSTLRHVPLPSGLVAGALNDISCVSDSLCVAVGGARHRSGRWTALTERWNGAGWAPMHPPEDRPSPTELLGVDCRAATDCIAVGYADTRRGYTSVIERWNGSSWWLMPHPKPPGRSQVELGSISCPTTTWCMAVGSSANPNGLSYALVERWDGVAWSIMRIHHWDGASDNQLLGVSCPSTHACFAVGVTNQGQSALIQDWNGRSWSPHLLNDDDYSGLGSVFCFSAHRCLAAGGLGNSGGNSDYLERWSGTRWSMAQAVIGNEGQLYGVACSHRVNFCASVGDNVITWTGGKAWSYRSLNSFELEGVSCAQRMCIGVGGSNGDVESPVSLLIRDG